MVQHVQGSMAAARWARARAEGGGRGGRKRLADSEPHRRAARRSVGPAGAAEGGGCIFLKKVISQVNQVKSSQVKTKSGFAWAHGSASQSSWLQAEKGVRRNAK